MELVVMVVVFIIFLFLCYEHNIVTSSKKFKVRLYFFTHICFHTFSIVQLFFNQGTYILFPAKRSLIQKTEEPEGNLVPQHILLVGRGNEAIGYAGNLLAVLRTPAYLNRVLMIDGKVGRCLAVFHHMGC